MTLEEAANSIGRAVIYTPYYTTYNTTAAPYDQAERGVITSTNSTYVFVRYGTDQHSKATAADRLRLAAGGQAPEGADDA